MRKPSMPSAYAYDCPADFYDAQEQYERDLEEYEYFHSEEYYREQQEYLEEQEYYEKLAKEKESQND